MKQWFVLQVSTGCEELVKTTLERFIKKSGELSNEFGAVIIPAAKVKKAFEIQDSSDQQLFPGYILVEMESSAKAMGLVLDVPKAVRFLGGKNPIPLSKNEISYVLGQIKGEVAVSPEKSDFVIGSEVDIHDGPFTGFVGKIERVDDENEKLTVMVSIFGRLTPVELSFDQIKK